MKWLIAYATSEGQTAKIARAALHHLFDLGHTAELLPLSAAGSLELERYDAAILASPIHAGKYKPELSEFAAENAEALARLPTLFLSVSLAAAGHDADDWRALDQIAADFSEATGWHPQETAQIAGAYTPSQYDIVTRLIMRRIVASKDPSANLAEDHEYTDWTALRAVINGWLTSLKAP